jgi:hypothetical protein
MQNWWWTMVSNQNVSDKSNKFCGNYTTSLLIKLKKTLRRVLTNLNKINQWGIATTCVNKDENKRVIKHNNLYLKSVHFKKLGIMQPLNTCKTNIHKETIWMCKKYVEIKCVININLIKWPSCWYHAMMLVYCVFNMFLNKCYMMVFLIK